ncbi:MAG: MATE family efflux transporter [Anaerolineales bacterium]|nr:MAG: MATE family efflux transporter [Anaerolineales bacterium]
MSSGISLRRSQAFAGFFSDRDFYQRLFKIALPIALTQFIMSSLNMVGVLMIGQLGAVPVAAVGLANQIFFLLNLMLFGIYSGSAMFTAQLWGMRDIPNIRKVLGLALSLGLAAGALFLVIAEAFPVAALSIYSRDPAVVALGSEYLRIIGLTFIPYAISFCYAAVLRSTGDVQTPLIVTIASLSLNTVLSFLLIFGKLGFPMLGVHGAGVAVLVSRMVELSLMLFITYRKQSAAAAKIKELFSFDASFAKKVLKPVLPVVVNEMLWSLGITAYSVVYARISTDSIAAMNIVGSFEQLAFVVFNGIGHACAVLVGNRIGAGEDEQAFRYGARSEALGVLGGVAIGSLILLSSNLILYLYKVPPQVIEYASRVLIIVGSLLWLKSSNVILFIGILRSGGDPRFALILDGLIIWVVGVPLAFLGAFVFHLPVYWVYLLVMTEELTKWCLGLYRFFSRKWIHNLAMSVTG